MSHDQQRRRWRAFPRQRPPEVVSPGVGQESVWDYPRPPRLEEVAKPVRVELGDAVLAESKRALRVCETAGPPVYYLPRADARSELLEPSPLTSFCEWKGDASYWHARLGDRFVENAAWSYATPDPAFAALRDHLAFFASRVDACFVGDDRVVPQPGSFYGGWITPELVGPFKGGPGSEEW